MKSFTWMLLGSFALLVQPVGAETEKLDLNDVTWLWPAPQTVEDLEHVISIADVNAADETHVWSDAHFGDLLRAADSDAAKVGDHRIKLPAAVREKSAWKIAAFRVDSTAPGGHDIIRQMFGERPQIRLILQPVTVSGDEIEVHDIAVHLVYDFLRQGEGQAVEPDKQKFGEIVSDLRVLKKLVREAGVDTNGKPLGVHPGLKAGVPELQERVRGFLSEHLHASKIGAMAIMGLDPPEPWIFLALAKAPGGERFGPIPFLPAEMLNFRTRPPEVSPPPVVNNLNPQPSGQIMPAEAKDRVGVATAPLFGEAGNELDSFAVIGETDAGEEVRHDQIRNRDIPDIVAHPERSHFFNTDCVSCHTETRRRMQLSLPVGKFAFRRNGVTPEVDPDALPKHDWNVRNLGWFQLPDVIGGGPPVGTVTQRTANETAEVVNHIEREYRGDSAASAGGGARGGLVYLDQGWSDPEREDFYYLSQGSQLIPYDWFLSLERADGEELLRSDANMRSLGFIPQKPSGKNPDGLPIGFVKDLNILPIQMKAGFLGPGYERDAYPVVSDWMGFTCAACHTAEIMHNDQVIRIDGGSAMADLESFLAELAKSLRSTVTDDEKFKRFEQRIKQAAGADVDTTGLRNRVEEYTPVIERLVMRNKAEHAYGLGRLDAFGAILNQLCAGSLQIPENAQPSNAPVSYPFLWYTPHMDWVQWNSVANIPISRNVGEVLGVFAHVQLTGTPAVGQFDSSARLHSLDRLEQQLAKLRSPVWPEEILGEIDQQKATAGKQLFKQNCSQCHNTRDESGEFEMTELNEFGARFIKTTNVHISEIGTDPQMALNFVTRLAKPGDLSGRIDRDDPVVGPSLERLKKLFAALGRPEPDFSEQLPAALLLSAAVTGVIEKQMQQELAGRPEEERKAIMLELRDRRTNASPPNGGAGYKAGPLAGVWATAPFGHAGAVPNLYQWLLPEDERVKSFHVGSRVFDPKHVGFSTEPTDDSFVFRTETDDGVPIPGNSNKGHSGERHTEFSDEERWQIIEYLKTLK
ncbi:MAG: hypothetical protein KY475_08320 [Planctomycetes bacterium]|nr:hypothetical protein [Planctomycetota bacterium]